MKNKFALMVIHTGEVKLKNSESCFINNVKKGDLLTFKTKKEALIFITEKLFWALKVVKVKEINNKWHNQETFYQFI